MPDTYYQALGLPEDASAEDIRRAYRSLARKWHPDANPDNPQAPERFRQISEAHEVLSDPEKRKAYDRTLAPDNQQAKRILSIIQDFFPGHDFGFDRAPTMTAAPDCKKCKGTGLVKHREFGFVFDLPCPSCTGIG